jgi:ribokinase
VSRLAPKIIVVGSLNVDLIAQVPSLPGRGETILATRVLRRFGGKGANQALAASRQGAEVRLIGAVGDDAYGTDYLAHWQRHGLDVSGISVMPCVATGMAFIAVQADGENQIIAEKGANKRVTPALVRAQAAHFRDAKAVLLQGEVPVSAILETMRLARKAGARVIFNPAPWPEGFPWGRAPIDLLVVNRPEAMRLFGRAPERLSAQARRARAAAIGAACVVITRGADSTLVFDGDGSFEVPTLSVQPVDTVGAGDAFVGTLAVWLAEGAPMAEAVRAANVAGALATLKPGAQEACPTRAQVRRRM